MDDNDLNAAMRERFYTELSKLLNQFYEDLKLHGRKNAVLKNRIEGFMLAGTRLGIAEEDDLHGTMEKAHRVVFGESISERRLKEVKGESEEIDWQYYDKPITQRRPKT